MQRIRLTITLQKDLVDILDSYIDGTAIRNRSHAIETLLQDKVHSPIKKAVILAADQGIKFRPFTYETPKAMLPIKGRPLLEHIITRLRDNEIRDIYLSVGYLSDKITSYFGDGSKFGVHINYVTQNKELGTAGALKKFQQFFKEGEPFFLIYGDVLAKINYKDMAIFYYRRRNAFAIAALTTVAHPELWGVAKLKGHNIVDFIEKPEKSKAESHLISAGIYIFTSAIFHAVSPNKAVGLEKDILPTLVKKHKVSGYILEGAWYDISTPQVYADVLKEWK